MKKKKIVMCLSSLLVVSLIATGCGKEVEVKNGSKVAVSVKGNKTTATEYYEKIKEDNIATLIEMIDRGILEKKYKEDDEEKKYIDKQVEQIKSYYGANETTFKTMLQQYFGVETEDELRTKLSLEYRRNKAVEEYIESHLSDKEIKDYYNDNVYGEVSASHILISIDTKDGATDDEKAEAEKKALEKAEKVIKELNEGKKFSTLAKKYSTDKATATKGGDLGYFDLDDMVKEFSDAVKNLKKDEYTKEAVKTEYGYHIILKTGEKKKPKLKDVKKDIKEKIRKQRLEDDSTLYYETLIKFREENKLKWNDDKLKKAYNEYMQKLIDNAKKQQEESNE